MQHATEALKGNIVSFLNISETFVVTCLLVEYVKWKIKTKISERLDNQISTIFQTAVLCFHCEFSFRWPEASPD